MKQKQRLFEIAEYAEKVRAALVKLEKTQQPGERSGKGGKTEVLQAAKNEIKAMLGKGYTSKQIADALKEDIFGILPKTITELVSAKRTTTKQKAGTSPARRTPVTAPLVAKHKQNDAANVQQKKQITELGDVE